MRTQGCAVTLRPGIAFVQWQRTQLGAGRSGLLVLVKQRASVRAAHDDQLVRGIAAAVTMVAVGLAATLLVIRVALIALARSISSSTRSPQSTGGPGDVGSGSGVGKRDAVAPMSHQSSDALETAPLHAAMRLLAAVEQHLGPGMWRVGKCGWSRGQ